MAMKDERIFFMEDYAGNLTAVPESKMTQFRKSQEELKRRIAAGEDVDRMDPETLAGIQKLIQTCMERRSNSNKNTQDS